MGGDGTKMNSEVGGGGGGGAPNSVRSERKRKRPICLKMIAAVDIFQRKFCIHIIPFENQASLFPSIHLWGSTF